MDSVRDIIIQCAEDSAEWFPEKKGDVAYLTICMSGEMGEFANMVKKAMRGTSDPGDPEYMFALQMELTDLFIYVMNMAAVLDVDLGEAYDIKREFNAARFGAVDNEAESGIRRVVPDPTSDGSRGIRTDEIPGGGLT